MSDMQSPLATAAAVIEFDATHRGANITHHLGTELTIAKSFTGDYDTVHDGEYVATQALRLARAIEANRWESPIVDEVLADIHQRVEAFAANLGGLVTVLVASQLGLDEHSADATDDDLTDPDVADEIRAADNIRHGLRSDTP